MDKMKAIIIEDESLSRDILKNYLSTYCTSVDVLGEAANIDAGEQLILKQKPDLVFLDIEMPFGNGFDLLDRLDQIDFEVVFITAYSDYAIKALNLSAAYYILKPIDIDELINAVEKIQNNLANSNEISSTKILSENIKALSHKDQKIVLPQMDGFEVVKIGDIIRAEASDNYTIFHLVNGKKYTISKTLKYYQDLLSDFGFLRTHKSHLINLSHVVKYKKGKIGEAVMKDQSIALISTSMKKEFIKYFTA